MGNAQSRDNNLSDKVKKWLIFSVLIVIAPTFVKVVLPSIAGYTIDIKELMPDVLLTAFSIFANVLASEINAGDKLGTEKEKMYFWTIVSLVCSAILYLSLFNTFGFIPESIHKKIPVSNVWWIFWIVIVVSIVNIRWGVLAESKSDVEKTNRIRKRKV